MSAGRTDPYLDYRYQVEVDSLLVAGFAEVSGLEREVDTEPYEEGGVNHFTHDLPTRVSTSNLTLERGLTDSVELWNWIEGVARGTVERRNVRVFLQDATGEEVWGWEAQDAYPVNWSGPDLAADGGAVAMESLELAHRGLRGVDGVP